MKIKKKILKNFLIQNLLALIAVLYIFIVRITSNIKIDNVQIPQEYWNTNKPFILAFWHSQLMMISFSWHIKKKINILASGHSDGRFGAMVGSYFKLNNLPTSSNIKSISLRPIFKILKSNNYIGITPDGPRGPKEKVSEGIIKIAKSAKVPIIPIGYWSSNRFNLSSWDSFLITLPFSKCNFVWGDPIIIPSNLNHDGVEKYKKILENEINSCIKKAKKNTK